MGAHEQLTKLRNENTRLRAEVKELKEENDQLHKENAFWLGEGQEKDPDVIEYRELALIKTRTKDQRSRIGYLADRIMMRDEHTPELLKRINELQTDAEAGERLSGDDEHPENKCDLCGGKNITWFAESDLWNKYADPAAILCPLCFVRLAIEGGENPTAWRLAPADDSDECGSLRVRFHEAMDIVGRLPLTENKVRVVPGLELYDTNGIEYYADIEVFVKTSPYHIKPVTYWEQFSTPEALHAAKPADKVPASS